MYSVIRVEGCVRVISFAINIGGHLLGFCSTCADLQVIEQGRVKNMNKILNMP